MEKDKKYRVPGEGLEKILCGTGYLYLLTQAAVFLKLSGTYAVMSAVAAASFWYMKELLFCRFPGIMRSEKWRWLYWSMGTSIIFVYLMADGFLSSFHAVCYYRAFNVQILTPVLLSGYILSAVFSGFCKKRL